MTNKSWTWAGHIMYRSDNSWATKGRECQTRHCVEFTSDKGPGGETIICAKAGWNTSSPTSDREAGERSDRPLFCSGLIMTDDDDECCLLEMALKNKYQ